MGTVFIKSTRPLQTLKQVTDHVKYVGFRSKEAGEKGFFDKHNNNSNYKTFLEKIKNNPALKHSQSIKAQKLIFSLRGKDYEAFKNSGKDYKDLIRKTLGEYERTKGVKLEWIANVHEKDDHPHCHVVIMGVSSEKDPIDGKFKRIFFTKDDYAKMKGDFETEFDKSAEYYNVEKIDLAKTMREIEKGFDKVGPDTPFKDRSDQDVKFEYGKYTGKINLYAAAKQIKSEVVIPFKDANSSNKYFKDFTDKDIDTLKTHSDSTGLNNISFSNVKNEITKSTKLIKSLQADIEKVKSYGVGLNNLTSAWDKRESALNKLENMSLEDRINNREVYENIRTEFTTNNNILKEFGVTAKSDIEEKINSFNADSKISDLKECIVNEKDRVAKLTEVNKILRSSFKTEMLKTYNSVEFKHMSFDQYASLKAINEYHGTNLTTEQIRERYSDIDKTYKSLTGQLKEVISNNDRLANAAHVLSRLERCNKILTIIDNRPEPSGFKYHSDRQEAVKDIEFYKEELKKLNVNGKDDLREQIHKHNGNSRFVHELKEKLFEIKPEHDLLEKVNEGMDRSIEIEERIEKSGFIDLGKGFEMVMKKMAHDLKREQAKAEITRKQTEKEAIRKGKQGRDR